MKKILAVILAVIFIAAAAGYFIWESRSYVAKVGKWKIKDYEYTFFLRAQKRTTESKAGANNDAAVRELWKTPVDGEDPVAIVMNQALENAKEFKIQLIKAEQEKFRLSEKERREVMDYLNNTLKNPDNVNYVKNDLGLTVAQFRDMMLKSELVGSYSYSYMQKNRDAVSVSDEEVKTYYDENRESIDDVTVRHLLLRTDIEGLTVEQKREKKELAENLKKRIENGEDMAALVKEYSEDTGSKDSGGVYTFTETEAIEKGFAQEFADWSLNAEIGDLEIVQTKFGYHIMRLEGKQALAEKMEQIRSTLKAEKLSEYYNSQVKEWSKDPAFNLEKNEKVLNRITKKNFPE